MFRGDAHEPQEILRPLSLLPDFEVADLRGKYSDYMYDGAFCFCHESNEYNIERKTINDLLSNLDAVEQQLALAMKRHPDIHNRLIVEGVWEPAAQGLLVYQRYQGKNMMTAGINGQQQQTFKKIANWLRQVGKYWEVVQSATMASTASLISAHYASDQEDEEHHSTFKRMYKLNDYVPNEQANRIMGASGEVKVGPALSERIANHFGTAWKAWSAGGLIIPEINAADRAVMQWTKVPGVGQKLAEDYLRGIGRTDL